MVRCADSSLYTGITTDIARRIDEHNDAHKAAKYTRARQPVSLVYAYEAKDRSEALQKEAALKKLPRKEKLRLVSSNV